MIKRVWGLALAAGALWLGQASAQIDVGGYALLVTDGGRAIVHSEFEGIASPEAGTPVTGDTVFHIASLSKQITAAALALAIQEGKVALDAPVSDYIPETEKYGDALTVAHLVYFTSGLTEPYDIERQSDLPWFTHYYFTVDEAIETSLSADSLQFDPGSEWRYNNINFMLIAKIVETAFGEPFSQVVETRIFAPLGMTSTYVNDDITEVIPNRADGMLPRIPPIIEALEGVGIKVAPGDDPIMIRRNAPHYGGSGVMTSVHDWARWQEEMLSHTVFGDDFWQLMVRTQRFNHPKDNDAFGLVHANIDGEPTLWFAGDDVDASSYSVVATEAGITSVCFSNNRMFSCQDKALAGMRAALEARD